MKAKNRKERRNSFLKFVALFVVTVGIIITALYFDFNKVPIEENKILRSELTTISKEMEFQKEFSDEVKAIKVMIDSLDIPGQNISFLNSLISDKAAKLQQKIPVKDSTYRYNMYKHIVASLSEIQKLKQQLSVYSESEKTILEYKEALDECRVRLNAAERTIDALRNN